MHVSVINKKHATGFNILLNASFLAENNYPVLPHLQGGIKFSTQIAVLLNFILLIFQNSPHFLLSPFQSLGYSLSSWKAPRSSNPSPTLQGSLSIS